MAQQRYGNCIQVNGSPLFKKIVIQLTVQNNIPITFADFDLESQRQKITSQQEKQHGQSKRYEFNDGRRTSRSNEIIGRTNREGNQQKDILSRTKPNAISTRQGPPAEGQNSLRDLPQLAMVQLTGRCKMLLQDNAHDKLERQELQSDNHVRRQVSGLGQKKKIY